MFSFKSYGITSDLIWRISWRSPVTSSTTVSVSFTPSLGCAQQHGSVFWKTKVGLERLRNLHASNDDATAVADIHCLLKNPFLVDLLKSSFSRLECPIWMDSSTSEQCRAMEEALGGAESLFQITGSKAYERFTASQIRKVAQRTPDVYHQTERIQLLSNFLASVLLGDYAPIDLSDGSGMNLLDLRRHAWSDKCLELCGEHLEEKLGKELVCPQTVLGPIAKYFVERYGLTSDCQIVSFTGDNPSSYYALASDPKSVVISLGTEKERDDELLQMFVLQGPVIQWWPRCRPRPCPKTQSMAICSLIPSSARRTRIYWCYCSASRMDHSYENVCKVKTSSIGKRIRRWHRRTSCQCAPSRDYPRVALSNETGFIQECVKKWRWKTGNRWVS